MLKAQKGVYVILASGETQLDDAYAKELKLDNSYDIL
jgi:hypothetical protein